MSKTKRLAICFLSLGVLAFFGQMQPSLAQEAPQLSGEFGDWLVYKSGSGNSLVCYALSRPVSSETDPPGRNRGDIFFFVSTRPGENVRDEISTLVGYPLRENSDVIAEIGDKQYLLYTNDDGAWIKTAAEEPAMVADMRAGSQMIIRGVSSRGTRTTDRYSLRGITAALNKVAADCG